MIPLSSFWGLPARTYRGFKRASWITYESRRDVRAVTWVWGTIPLVSIQSGGRSSPYCQMARSTNVRPPGQKTPRHGSCFPSASRSKMGRTSRPEELQHTLRCLYNRVLGSFQPWLPYLSIFKKYKCICNNIGKPFKIYLSFYSNNNFF